MSDQDDDPWETSPVRPLGHVGTERFFYFVRETRQVVSLAHSQHTQTRYLAMADEESWQRYPRVRVERNGVQWSSLAEIMMQDCRGVGIYDPSCVRGRGAWRDGTDTVYHAGDALFVNGELTEFENYRDTRHQDLTCTPVLRPAKNAATSTDIDGLLAIIETWDWQQPDLSPKLVVGWLACALVCGALGWRPHLWVTGPKGSGKSTLDNLVTNILGDLVLHVQGGTTEPGLRQALNGDARPVAFDEFEASNPGARAVIDAARSAASDNAAPIIKGTPEGRHLIYHLRFMALFSGIVANLDREADTSRIVCLEVRCRQRDEEQRAKLAKALHEFRAEFGSKLLRRILDALVSGVFDQSLVVLRTAIRASGGDERKADVFAHLLAGYHSLRNDQPATEAEARDLVTLLSALDETEPSDEEACASHLLGYRLRIELDQPRTVAEWLYALRDGTLDERMATTACDELARHGVLLDGDCILVANSAPGVRRLFHGSQWANGAHWRILRRLAGARPAGNRRFAKAQSKATAIRWNTLFPGD